MFINLVYFPIRTRRFFISKFQERCVIEQFYRDFTSAIQIPFLAFIGGLHNYEEISFSSPFGSKDTRYNYPCA